MEIGWLMIFFLLPLFFVPVVYGTWQISGSFLFQTLVEIICFLWLVRIIFGGLTFKKVRPLREIKRILPAIIFISVLGLATIFSQSFYYSFWGYYARKMGYLMWLHLFFFFLILFFNLKNLKQIFRIFYVIIGTAAIAVFYGFLQTLGLDFFRWSESPSISHRVFSTFGQPNFFASWLLLILPIIFWIILRHENHRHLTVPIFSTSSFSVFKKYFLRPIFTSLFFLTLIILIVTQSRSGWLSFILASFFFIIVFSWFKNRKKLSAILFLFLIFSIIFLTILNLNPLSVGENENPLMVRLKTLSNLSAAGQLRFFWWKNSVDLIKQKPWLGYGPETFGLNSPKYYQPECAALEGINQIPDRAHNDFLDMLLISGIFGLLSYLFLIGSVFWLGLKYVFKKFQSPDYPITQSSSAQLAVLFLLTGLLGYLISLQLSFHVISTAVYFWGYLAIIYKITDNRDTITK